MKPINWTPIFEKYPGMWVALKEDEVTVVAASKSAKTAADGAKKKGLKIPILLKVPSRSLPYVGANSIR